MLERIENLQGALVRAESYVLVVCVLAMLVLAAYNVLYRNVLVPVQMRLQEMARASAPAQPGDREGRSPSRPSGSDRSDSGSAAASDESTGDESGGFGGGFGGDQGGGNDAKETGSGSSAGGFGGGFGGSSPDSADAGVRAESGSGGAEPPGGGGFEGGFGSDSTAPDTGVSESGSGGFEGGFGGTDRQGGGESADGSGSEAGGFGGGFGGGEETAGRGASADKSADSSPSPGEAAPDGAEPRSPPERASWTRFGVQTIDTLKLIWIDAFLRHMVLVVGFLGGMIATRRREHITIDAARRLLTGRSYHVAGALTNLFATVACGVLAAAGWELVALGLEYPEWLLPGVRTWAVQLMFPIGFGMMGLHFLLRALENGLRVYRDEPVEAARREDGDRDPEPRDGDEEVES